MAKVTLKQVAEACNVSVNTVSLAMHDSKRLPESTRTRIRNIAEAMNYEPNRMAQALIGGSTKTIGLLMYTLSDAGHLQFFNAAEQVIKKAGYSVLMETIIDSNYDKVLNKLMSSGIDGLIVNSSSVANNMKLLDFNFKNICLAGKEFVSGVPFDQIYYIEYEGSRMLMQHLIDLGHRRIGFITAVDPGSDPRMAAYKATLSEAGIAYDDEMFVYIPYGEFSIENIDIARARLMGTKERPTAIFSYHDEVALKLMFSLQKAGFSIPDDVAVTGINNTWTGEFSLIPLTSLDFKLALQGRLSAETMIKRIENPDLPPVIEKIIPELHIRRSTVKE